MERADGEDNAISDRGPCIGSKKFVRRSRGNRMKSERRLHEMRMWIALKLDCERVQHSLKAWAMQ